MPPSTHERSCTVGHTLAAVFAILAVACPGLVTAGGPDMESGTAPSTKSASPAATKVSAEQAEAIALKAVPGKVTEVAIERKHGKRVYVVEIETGTQGERDVFVDMSSGEVIGTD